MGQSFYEVALDHIFLHYYFFFDKLKEWIFSHEIRNWVRSSKEMSAIEKNGDNRHDMGGGGRKFVIELYYKLP